MTSNNPETVENEALIFQVNENNFAEKIIEKSEGKLILIDFWAPWCEPCKKLTPILEEVIKEADGIVSLAKIKIDENQQLATQLSIQSIPTVIAFHNKQIVNGFQGILSKKKIIEFIEKVSGKSFPKNKDEFYNKINELIAINDLATAIRDIENFLSDNSSDVKAISLYINCLSGLNKFKDVKEFIDSLSDTLISDQNIQKAINKYKMLESVSKEPSIEILLSNYTKQPNNIENLIKLCDKYFFEKQYEQAFELLLDNYSKLKNTSKEKVKKTLLKYFDTLGNSHEQTKIYRRKFSSLLFS